MPCKKTIQFDDMVYNRIKKYISIRNLAAHAAKRLPKHPILVWPQKYVGGSPDFYVFP